MDLQCAQCSRDITSSSDHRLPPWCPHCGADLKPAGVVRHTRSPVGSDIAVDTPAPPAWELEQPVAPEAPVEPAGEDWEGVGCPACRRPIDLPDWADGLVVFCPDCGQCLEAPQPWPAAPADHAINAAYRLGVPTRPKLSGWTGLGMGSAFVAAAWLIPGDGGLAFRLAGTTLGGALIVEGLGRLQAAAQKRQTRKAAVLELPQELPPNADQLGRLKAVYQTANSAGSSLAIFLMGCFFLCLEVGMLDWMRHGRAPAKAYLAVVVAPLLVVYLFYRAARSLVEGRRLLVFANGLLSCRGRRCTVYLREQIARVERVEIGDAIDEWAVQIHLSRGEAPLRFTCNHVDNLEHLYANTLSLQARGPWAGQQG